MLPLYWNWCKLFLSAWLLVLTKVFIRKDWGTSAPLELRSFALGLHPAAVCRLGTVEVIGMSGLLNYSSPTVSFPAKIS
mgnify:CR=1 FL=1